MIYYWVVFVFSSKEKNHFLTHFLNFFFYFFVAWCRSLYFLIVGSAASEIWNLHTWNVGERLQEGGQNGKDGWVKCTHDRDGQCWDLSSPISAFGGGEGREGGWIWTPFSLTKKRLSSSSTVQATLYWVQNKKIPTPLFPSPFIFPSPSVRSQKGCSCPSLAFCLFEICWTHHTGHFFL